MSRLATVRPDGTGSIVPRGNRHKAQYQVSDEMVGGKRIRKFASKTFDTKAEAEDWLAAQKTDRNRGEWVEPNKLTVSELLARWLEIKEPKLGFNTFSEIQSVIRNRIEHPEFGIGNVLVQSLKTDRIHVFYSALRKPGAKMRSRKPARLSETSIKRTHEILTGALGWAQENGIIVKNPCKMKDAPKANKAKPKAWTAEQMRLFLAQEDQILKVGPLWEFMAQTGVRLSEALGLLWGDDVDTSSGSVSINRRNLRDKGQKTMRQVEGTKTIAGTRVINIDPVLCHSLKTWRLSQGVGARGLVFPFQDAAVDREFTRRVKTAGIPDNGVHCLRHTMATQAIKSGVPVKVISERLGHTDPAFTLRQYAHCLPGMQKEAAATLSALFAQAQ